LEQVKKDEERGGESLRKEEMDKVVERIREKIVRRHEQKGRSMQEE